MNVPWALLKWRFGREHKKTISHYKPQYASPDLERIHHPDPDTIQLTWVGHATFLIQIAGVNILTDPIWSDRASPVSWLGPTRHARPGMRFEDLPKIDIVVLSHTHYDHLDRPTILKLGNKPHYIVPPGVAKWFAAEKITNVTELAWWKDATIDALKITAVPAKHWSRRWPFINEGMGWGGYVIQSPKDTIYFAGDTGYHVEYFKEIGKRFPGIDLGLIPIGAYYPREIFGISHVDPREAIEVHREVGAKRSIGMHWGVFQLTQEPLEEPPERLAKERAALGMQEEEFSTMKIGETRSVIL